MSQGPPPQFAPPPWQPSGWQPIPAYAPLAATQFSATAAYSRGWDLFKRNYGAALGVTFIAQVIIMAVSIIPVVGGIASIFAAPLSTAAILHLARLERHEPTSVDMIFKAFGPKYWNVLIAQFLVGLANVALALPVAGVIIAIVLVVNRAGSIAISAGMVGAAISIAIGLVAMAIIARIQFVPLLMLEAPHGSLDIGRAFRMSWSHTRMFILPLVLLMLLMAATSVLSVLVLIIGVILIAMPLIACIQAATYNMLFVTINSRCQTCGYDLQGAAGLVCPECGTPISPVPAA